ncbi:hypothetical protein [Eudoraea adriatica]|uniref:hypothetical protein n=1 Tax=Eudoraea adriatica TaxID=446681 RepID=UPI00035DAE3E|nr:hypothetical protein [Eudoraea adriatica]
MTIKFLTIGLIVVTLASASCSAEDGMDVEFVSQEFPGFTVTDSTDIENSADKFITVANISEMLSLIPDDGMIIKVNAFAIDNDGGGGIFQYHEAQTGINNGGTVIDGWVRQYDNNLINIKWFGAKGDGIKDDSIALQAALDVGGFIIFDKATYNIGTQLSINQPCSIDLNGATITSSTIMRLIAVNKNTTLTNGNITTTYASSSQSLFGIIESMNTSLDFLKLQDLFIDGGSNSEIDGIKIDCTVNNSIINDITIDNVVIENTGIMGIEIISHTGGMDDDLNHVNNVTITNLKTKNTGTISTYGMGISISGGVRKTVINGIIVDDFKDIGIENAGGKIFLCTNFEVKNPKLASDIFVATQQNQFYTSNENTVFMNGDIRGNGKINFKSDSNPIIVNNLQINGDVKIDAVNAVINNSTINTGNVIQSLDGGKLVINNTMVFFKSGISRFQANTSEIELNNVTATRTDDGMMIFCDTGSSLSISYGKFTDGYIQVDSGSTGIIKNFEYDSVGSGNGFIGLGSYTFSFVFSNGVLIDNR